MAYSILHNTLSPNEVNESEHHQLDNSCSAFNGGSNIQWRLRYWQMLLLNHSLSSDECWDFPTLTNDRYKCRWTTIEARWEEYWSRLSRIERQSKGRRCENQKNVTASNSIHVQSPKLIVSSQYYPWRRFRRSTIKQLQSVYMNMTIENKLLYVIFTNGTRIFHCSRSLYSFSYRLFQTNLWPICFVYVVIIIYFFSFSYITYRIQFCIRIRLGCNIRFRWWIHERGNIGIDNDC